MTLRKRILPIHLLTGRCPNGMPNGAWKGVRVPMWPIWILFAIILVYGMQALLMLMHWEGIISISLVPSSQVMVAWSIAVVVACICLWAIPHMRERRFHRAVLALHYEVCLNCGYNLTGLPAKHECPECGSTYQKEKVCQEWRAWFDSSRQCRRGHG